jgi:hypothetical protein|tara:strand:+ start:1407 stop:2000 length:594 start_codon:yes stop_codon:yes gene_type:complete
MLDTIQPEGRTMDTDQNKSVSVDYETWKVLMKWAEKECRTISGQVRFLTKKYAPKDLQEVPSAQPLSLPPPSVPEPIKLRPVAPQSLNEWQSRPPTQQWFRRSPTKRMAILEVLLEYGSPITNTEISILIQNHEDSLIKGMDADTVGKHTSNMWTQGLLMRRLTTASIDRFEYVPHSRVKKMLADHIAKKFNAQVRI